jgi:23S rRNA (uracil1939-C5)-methyltransferase
MRLAGVPADRSSSVGWPGAWVGDHETSPAGENVVAIEKPIYGGAFLARVDGKAVFVPLTLPGEQVSIRTMQNKSGYSTAELTEILTPSPQRILPSCPHFGACGGCNYQHTSYESQLEFKQAILRETLERSGVHLQARSGVHPQARSGVHPQARSGVQPPSHIGVLSASPWSYRNRIRLAFDAEGNPGYRGRRSHSLIPISECPIAAPLLLSAAQAVAETLHRVPANLRPKELSLFCDPAETALLVTFFASDSTAFRLEPIANALHERIPALKSAELAADGRPGHPARTLAKWGEPAISYAVAGFNYRVDQGAFFQVNRWLVDALVECVTQGQSGELALDLFAGVGLFARKLTATFARVVAVESAPPAVVALEQNLNGTTGTAVRASTLDFLRQFCAAERPSQIVPNLIVLDPPRTGLGPEIITLLAAIAAPTLVYVSCDPATLARDLRALIASGYSIQSITLADLFPQTFHLETVVHLRHS